MLGVIVAVPLAKLGVNDTVWPNVKLILPVAKALAVGAVYTFNVNGWVTEVPAGLVTV